MTKYAAAIDQGTTSTRFMLFNHDAEVVSIAQKEHEQIFPKPGWVEHDPLEILRRTHEVARRAMQEANVERQDIVALGITNQR